MECPKCHNKMIISSWDGWIWLCVFCGHEGHTPTPEEQSEYGKENQEYFETEKTERLIEQLKSRIFK